MKKSYLSLIATAALLSMTACSQDQKKIKEFAREFAGNAEANLISDIISVYPDADFADSVAIKLNEDSLKVEKGKSENEYVINFGDNKSAVVKIGKGDSITVVETYGVFAYPESEIKTARRSGAYKSGLNDRQLAENMIFLDDMLSSLYEKAADERKSAITNAGVTITKDCEMNLDLGEGYYTLINNTDRFISGNEYDVTWLHTYGYAGMTDIGEEYRTDKGKDIPPHGTVRYEFKWNFHNDYTIQKINIKPLSEQEFFDNYVFNGNEFDLYLPTADASLIMNRKLSDGPYQISGKLGGSYPIHMFLEKGMRNGSYYYDKYGLSHPLLLLVRKFNRRTGKLIMDELNEKGEVTGTFRGTLSDTSFTGTMTTTAGKSHKFDFKVSIIE